MISPLLGLKGSSNRQQIDDRLQYHPDVYEFYTSINDFTSEGFQALEEAVQYVQSRGTSKIIIHHPMFFKKWHTELVAPERDFPEIYRFIESSTEQLIDLAQKRNIQVLVHGGYAGKEVQKMVNRYPSVEAARQAVYNRLDRFARAGGNHIMFENSIAPVFSYGHPEQEDEILSHNYRLAFDTSHCFIEMHGNNQALQASLKHLQEHVVHYHLVDSLGQAHDSLQLGKGKIDWIHVLKLLNPDATNIYEINLRDQSNCREQVESHHYLVDLVSKLNQGE
ncbi:TIM barrel protein [Limosilactobacillus fastidiosus]|uniref:Sugar phosphate isomerase/epimerase n=1 Tax=Limosilactobacillus fastidiosus TaxID=2759855 RepID=A0A7W3TZD0_9LACO|nr:TIM barrel protein [Limosilactobacillus fastidiosus]MBB1062697.1 sugar phosphate isomerase/epimerase [Limosilactobacillus fastidiosus]MBB1085795.1 sugar phosphate isomerase/epimerase [Limosilactobacillus fastidiosus]MCD7083933.1 TIM barrel protein [Limosilactobacillus fastidiosus]MCD7085868.1 TIM barrel protein [Limosilactobacillus fastidiosus]MCD7113945.1 TIM barrel protein [Limosilactobacillus fastidiosus]